MFALQGDFSDVKYSNDYENGSESYTVFQVNDDVLEELKKKRQLQIKGQSSGDQAVLVLENKCYTLQRREYSNTYLYCTEHSKEETGNKKEFNIHLTKQNQVELIPFIPNTQALYRDLYENRLTEEHHEEILGWGYEFTEIQDKYSISDIELMNFLSTIKAMNISTRWFLIDENFLINIYHRLLHNYNKEENDTGILVYPDIMSNFMTEYPKFLIHKTLETYCQSNGEQNGKRYYQLTYLNVCEVLSKETLLAKESYYFTDFSAVIETLVQMHCPRSLHEFMDIDEKQEIEQRALSKFATIIDENNVQSNHYNNLKVFVKLVKPHEFPADPKERLKYLFNIKKRFFYEEICYWLKDLAHSSKDIDNILLKHARTYQEKVSKAVYNSFRETNRPYKQHFTDDVNAPGNWCYVRVYGPKY